MANSVTVMEDKRGYFRICFPKFAAQALNLHKGDKVEFSFNPIVAGLVVRKA
jgi:hypothetical protein